MADEVSSQVVGGYREPRFLLVGPELSPNVGFEVDTTGWSGNATILRAFDATAPFGDYVLTIEDDSALVSETSVCSINAGEPIAGLKFIVTFWARNDTDDDAFFNTLFVPQAGGSTVIDHNSDGVWRMYTQEVVIDAQASGNTFFFGLSIGASLQGVAATGKVRIDNFRCRKVIDEFELPMPDRNKIFEQFVEEFQSQNELSNKTQLSYSAGHRYFYQAEYERITSGQEVLRRKALTRDYDVLFFPHKDSAQNYFVEWDGELEIGWAFGAATFGHKGNVTLKAVDLIPRLPSEIIDATNEYNPPSDPLVMGEGFYY